MTHDCCAFCDTQACACRDNYADQLVNQIASSISIVAQVQAQEVPARMQKELSCGEDRWGTIGSCVFCVLPAGLRFLYSFFHSSMLLYQEAGLCRQAMYRGVPDFEDGLDF